MHSHACHRSFFLLPPPPLTRAHPRVFSSPVIPRTSCHTGVSRATAFFPKSNCARALLSDDRTRFQREQVCSRFSDGRKIANYSPRYCTDRRLTERTLGEPDFKHIRDGGYEETSDIYLSDVHVLRSENLLNKKKE